MTLEVHTVVVGMCARTSQIPDEHAICAYQVPQAALLPWAPRVPLPARHGSQTPRCFKRKDALNTVHIKRCRVNLDPSYRYTWLT